MPIKALQDYLASHNVKYQSMTHSPAFTSQEVAAAAHVSGKQLAKVVVVKLKDQFALVMLPANQHINFRKLKESIGVMGDLATESEFKAMFPGCEVGAMPPFGHLYHLPLYVSTKLSKLDHIAFNAGSHSELIQMVYADFLRLEQPKEIAL